MTYTFLAHPSSLSIPSLLHMPRFFRRSSHSERLKTGTHSSLVGTSRPRLRVQTSLIMVCAFVLLLIGVGLLITARKPSENSARSLPESLLHCGTCVVTGAVGVRPAAECTTGREVFDPVTGVAFCTERGGQVIEPPKESAVAQEDTEVLRVVPFETEDGFELLSPERPRTEEGSFRYEVLAFLQRVHVTSTLEAWLASPETKRELGIVGVERWSNAHAKGWRIQHDIAGAPFQTFVLLDHLRCSRALLINAARGDRREELLLSSLKVHTHDSEMVPCN